jgi:2-dehydro-3-deoxygalactonokinase
VRPLIGVDWGTSSLRVARLNVDGHPAEQRELPRGILSVETGGFARVFDEVCGDWMKAPGALALICGMAGSRQGWMEAPYAECPATLTNVVDKLAWIEPGRIAIVPGLACESDGVPDVLRGEETQAFGALKLLGREDAVIVMPGTHSKWARMRGGRIESFATFMTGEFYALLRQHSILARTLATEDDVLDEAALARGVDHATASGNLLHAAFSARTLALFGRLTPEASNSYLSGLLIGEELRSQQLDTSGRPLVLVGVARLVRRYAVALSHRGLSFVTPGQEATWLGLSAIAQLLENER